MAHRQVEAVGIAVVVVGAALAACGGKPAAPEAADARPVPRVEHRAAHPNPSAAYRWVEVVLEASGRRILAVGARPTIVSREMAIPLTAMYDAWAAYDARAVGTRLGGALRRPAAERTRANKEKAIAYAVHRTLVDLFPEDRGWLDQQLVDRGYDPDDGSTDPATPQGVGNTVAAALIAYRRTDGANQHGDAPGTVARGTPYADTTGYAPVNTVDDLRDPDRWQPIPFATGDGGTVAPGFLTPHWFQVKPFALARGDALRPAGPPRFGSPELAREVAENVAMNASLTLEQKALVEFMRDGPRSTGQSGHWLEFAMDVSRRDGYDLDQDVKLFFVIANTAFDAFIASWDAKRHFDSSRPWSLVRRYYAGQQIEGWQGPCRGVGPIPAAEWRPYSPDTFVTPPFPGYPSGHSTVSGACARMLKLFTGSDRFGAYARHQVGEYTGELECPTEEMQARGGVPATGAPPSHEVLIELPSFEGTADLAGISRVLGGYHIQSDNVDGLALGRAVADATWPVYQAYFDGTATVRP